MFSHGSAFTSYGATSKHRWTRILEKVQIQFCLPQRHRGHRESVRSKNRPLFPRIPFDKKLSTSKPMKLCHYLGLTPLSNRYLIANSRDGNKLVTPTRGIHSHYDQRIRIPKESGANPKAFCESARRQTARHFACSFSAPGFFCAVCYTDRQPVCSIYGPAGGHRRFSRS